MYPEGHVHKYMFKKGSVQIPPFLHGFEAHSRTSMLHAGPVKPGKQTHVFVPFWSLTHLPLTHSGVHAKINFRLLLE